MEAKPWGLCSNQARLEMVLNWPHDFQHSHVLALSGAGLTQRVVMLFTCRQERKGDKLCYTEHRLCQFGEHLCSNDAATARGPDWARAMHTARASAERCQAAAWPHRPAAQAVIAEASC